MRSYVAPAGGYIFELAGYYLRGHDNLLILYSGNETFLCERLASDGPLECYYDDDVLEPVKDFPIRSHRLLALFRSYDTVSRSECLRRIFFTHCNTHNYPALKLFWTGAVGFAKSLIRFAEENGYAFTESGIEDLQGRRFFRIHREQDIFNILGLEYIPPRLRNCDFD